MKLYYSIPLLSLTKKSQAGNVLSSVEMHCSGHRLEEFVSYVVKKDKQLRQERGRITHPSVSEEELKHTMIQDQIQGCRRLS